MIIVLMGYMGSGKSTLGNALAKKIGYRFFDLDAVIEKNAQTTIPQLFEEKGNIYFRKLESELLQKIVLANENRILAVGGGTPCYSNNLSYIKSTENVVSIYLKLSIANLVQRLAGEKQQRPLIKDVPNSELPEFIGKHLFERNPFYQQADYTIECDKKDTDTLVKEIDALLSKINGKFLS